MTIIAQELREFEEARHNYQQALEINIEFSDRYLSLLGPALEVTCLVAMIAVTSVKSPAGTNNCYFLGNLCVGIGTILDLDLYQTLSLVVDQLNFDKR